ncbi:uncharacterized protein Tco025E_08562 [Trypanosoma conorhini]|uniref:Uncharacterized protein n=1 Tax=Trypanosoma conorhini TaxID=83891 RepID=A0A422N7Y4_9TRYP|nr:uncharacterized protein Tco025E_08562 [Trypanosoma conorhini]RNF01604.1 hypothetical protein Tco025E_08562 [Trypanosoma conorhini]
MHVTHPVAGAAHPRCGRNAERPHTHARSAPRASPVCEWEAAPATPPERSAPRSGGVQPQGFLLLHEKRGASHRPALRPIAWAKKEPQGHAAPAPTPRTSKAPQGHLRSAGAGEKASRERRGLKARERTAGAERKGQSTQPRIGALWRANKNSGELSRALQEKQN